MHLTGESLKKARVEKNFSIKHISKNLNISIDFIKKIENDDFTDNQNKTYLLGHIRSYANFLKLDSDLIINNFKMQTSFYDKNLETELKRPLDENIFFSFLKNKERIFNYSKTFSALSIIFISLGFYMFFIRSNDLQPNYSIIPDLPENLESSIEAMNMKIDLNNNKNQALISEANLNKIEMISKETFLKDKNILITDSSAVASLPNNNEVIENNITLKFLKSTWVQIRDVDDNIIYSKLMNKDETYSYKLSDKYFLTTGNAGNIIVMINGETRGKVGKKGEVLESFEIISDFFN